MYFHCFRCRKLIPSIHQVVFTGEPNQPGTTKPEEGERHPYSVLNCDDTRESILPVVLFLQKIIRRRPFMIKTLENVMKRLLQSLVIFFVDTLSRSHLQHNCSYQCQPHASVKRSLILSVSTVLIHESTTSGYVFHFHRFTAQVDEQKSAYIKSLFYVNLPLAHNVFHIHVAFCRSYMAPRIAKSWPFSRLYILTEAVRAAT